ncbi:MAG: hypothetical protein ABI318_12190 [Chthoniobacteraceae bacterium]
MKTRLLCTLLSLLAAWLPRAAADEWISEEYRCALTIPTHESWAAALKQQLPSGEMIFHAVSMTSSQGIAVTYAPDLPSSDIRNPVVLKRIRELLEAQGWAVETSSQLVWKGHPFVQFISQRRDVVAGKQVGVTRVTPRGPTTLYLITAYGKGEADRAADAEFMRVMETFRFIDQSAAIADHPDRPPAKFYRGAMIAASGAAVLLICAFAGVLFRVWRTAEDRA